MAKSLREQVTGCYWSFSVDSATGGFTTKCQFQRSINPKHAAMF